LYRLRTFKIISDGKTQWKLFRRNFFLIGPVVSALHGRYRDQTGGKVP
jgi:hypothetical protein